MQFILLYMNGDCTFDWFYRYKVKQKPHEYDLRWLRGLKKNTRKKTIFRNEIFLEWISMALIFFCIQFSLLPSKLCSFAFLALSHTWDMKKISNQKQMVDFQRNNRTNKHIDCIHLFLNAKQTTIASYLFSNCFCPACCIISGYMCVRVYFINVWYAKASFLCWIELSSTLLIIPKFFFIARFSDWMGRGEGWENCTEFKDRRRQTCFFIFISFRLMDKMHWWIALNERAFVYLKRKIGETIQCCCHFRCIHLKYVSFQMCVVWNNILSCEMNTGMRFFSFYRFVLPMFR